MRCSLITRQYSTVVFALMISLAGCGTPPKKDEPVVACRCLTKADLEAAIPGSAFQEGAPTGGEPNNDGSTLEQCHFSAAKGQFYPRIYVEIFTAHPPPITLDQLREQLLQFHRVDIHPVAGLGDGALWAVRPEKQSGQYKLQAARELQVIAKGHKFFNLSAEGMPEKDAEPILTKLAALVIERYAKVSAKP